MYQFWYNVTKIGKRDYNIAMLLAGCNSCYLTVMRFSTYYLTEGIVKSTLDLILNHNQLIYNTEYANFKHFYLSINGLCCCHWPLL